MAACLPAPAYPPPRQELQLLVFLGCFVVLLSVLGGFALQGGHLAALFQPTELLMIAGAAIGAFVIANDRKSMQATFDAIPTLFQSSQHNSALYLDLLSLMFDVLTKVRKEGLMSLEPDIEAPYQSGLFLKYQQYNQHKRYKQYEQ